MSLLRRMLSVFRMLRALWLASSRVTNGEVLAMLIHRRRLAGGSILASIGRRSGSASRGAVDTCRASELRLLEYVDVAGTRLAELPFQYYWLDGEMISRAVVRDDSARLP